MQSITKQNFTFLPLLSVKSADIQMANIESRLNDVYNRLYAIKNEKTPTKTEIVKYAYNPDAYKVDFLAPANKWLDKSGMPAYMKDLFIRLLEEDANIDADVATLKQTYIPMPQLKPSDIEINEHDKINLTQVYKDAYLQTKASRTLTDNEQALFERLKVYIAKTIELDGVFCMFKLYEHRSNANVNKFIRPNKTASDNIRKELDEWRTETDELGKQIAISGFICEAVKEYNTMTNERIADAMTTLMFYKKL